MRVPCLTWSNWALCLSSIAIGPASLRGLTNFPAIWLDAYFILIRNLCKPVLSCYNYRHKKKVEAAFGLNQIYACWDVNVDFRFRYMSKTEVCRPERRDDRGREGRWSASIQKCVKPSSSVVSLNLSLCLWLAWHQAPLRTSPCFGLWLSFVYRAKSLSTAGGSLEFGNTPLLWN